MAERGWGRIVNVTSSAGKRPSQTWPAYSVAKAGQHSLSRLYADRWAAQGVHVNAVAPGPTGTSLWRGPGGLAEQMAERLGISPGGGDRAPVGQGAARPLRRGRRGRGGRRLPLLRARLVGDRRGLVGRRRHVAVDALAELAEPDDHVAERDRRRIGRSDRVGRVARVDHELVRHRGVRDAVGEPDRPVRAGRDDDQVVARCRRPRGRPPCRSRARPGSRLRAARRSPRSACPRIGRRRARAARRR